VCSSRHQALPIISPVFPRIQPHPPPYLGEGVDLASQIPPPRHSVNSPVAPPPGGLPSGSVAVADVADLCVQVLHAPAACNKAFDVSPAAGQEPGLYAALAPGLPPVSSWSTAY